LVYALACGGAGAPKAAPEPAEHSLSGLAAQHIAVLPSYSVRVMPGLDWAIGRPSDVQKTLDADILAALDEGALAAATLDVFPHEPLPPQSALWSHPRVTITPHNAGDISPRLFAPNVIAQLDRFERGLPLDNLVDRKRGY
jgi:hypothetical protein